MTQEQRLPAMSDVKSTGGSEQNAPLGRAVIGGLLAATMMTLFVVPAVYSIFGRDVIGKKQRDREIEEVTLPGA